MKISRIFSAGLPAAALLLTGCVQPAEVDSTRDPKYRDVVGREYALREDFLACGVKRDYPSSRFDYVLIMPPPGLGGRFIVDLGHVPAGMRLRLVGVVTHRSKLFPSTQYVISFSDPSPALATDKEIRINDTALWNLYGKPTNPAVAPQLNERYFRPLN